MRGGKREGAGRKTTESNVRISVPIGIADLLRTLIAAYKSGKTKEIQQIKQLATLIITQADDTSPIKSSPDLNIKNAEHAPEALAYPLDELDDLEIEELVLRKAYHAELEQLYAESVRASAEIQNTPNATTSNATSK